jgi:hypothetical protein
MKLIDYAYELLEDTSVNGVKKIRRAINYLDGNYSLFPSTIIPFDETEAREVREMLIKSLEKKGIK